MMNFWIILVAAIGGCALGVFGTLLFILIYTEQYESAGSEWWDDDN